MLKEGKKNNQDQRPAVLGQAFVFRHLRLLNKVMCVNKMISVVHTETGGWREGGDQTRAVELTVCNKSCGAST